MKIFIKVFRINSKGQPCFLFHGNQGSCVVPTDKWIKADRKLVRDGTGKTWYESGFHAFRDLKAYEEWKKTTKNEYVFCYVFMKGLRKKKHSKYGDKVVLANQMRLLSDVWNNAVGWHDSERSH